jgi:uncharacterized protein (DUF1778 family)
MDIFPDFVHDRMPTSFDKGRHMPRANEKSAAAAKLRQPAKARKTAGRRKLTASRTSKINLRVAPDRLDLIDRAAKILGKTRTDFILDTAATAAQDTILDQRIIHLDPETYAFFIAELDRPPRYNPGLAKLFARKAPWEE